MQFERWFDLDISKGRAAQVDLGTLYEDDSNALKLGVRLYDGETPVDVTGTVSAWAILSNGITLNPFEDVGKTGNEAWTILPQSAMYPGQLRVYIRITGDNDFAVTLDATGAVKRTTTGAITTPSGPYPSADQIQALREQMEQVVEGWPIATITEAKQYLGIA